MSLTISQKLPFTTGHPELWVVTWMSQLETKWRVYASDHTQLVYKSHNLLHNIPPAMHVCMYFQNSEPGATLSIHSSAVIYRTAPSVVIVGLLQSKFRERQDGSRLLDVIFEVKKTTLIFRNCGLTETIILWSWGPISLTLRSVLWWVTYPNLQ